MKRINILVCHAIMIALVVLAAASARAVTHTWTGGAGDTNWFTAGNWGMPAE